MKVESMTQELQKAYERKFCNALVNSDKDPLVEFKEKVSDLTSDYHPLTPL